MFVAWLFAESCFHLRFFGVCLNLDYLAILGVARGVVWRQE